MTSSGHYYKRNASNAEKSYANIHNMMFQCDQEEGFLLFFLAVLAIASQISFFRVLLLLLPPVLAALLPRPSKASLTKNFNLHRVDSLCIKE